MSKPIDDGGPAFPANFLSMGNENYGASLRDYFAGQALAGLLASKDAMESLLKEMDSGEYKTLGEVIGKWTYGYADSLLKERNKSK